MDKDKIARELMRLAARANIRNLHNALSKVVDVKLSGDTIYSEGQLGLAEFNKVRKVLAKQLKWLGFEPVKKSSGYQLWRNEEVGGDEIEIISQKMFNGWSFSIEATPARVARVARDLVAVNWLAIHDAVDGVGVRVDNYDVMWLLEELWNKERKSINKDEFRYAKLRLTESIREAKRLGLSDDVRVLSDAIKELKRVIR
jgi:hypothetical protein